MEHGLKVRCMVLPDVFIDQDSPAAMYAKAGLDAKGIVAKVFEALGRERAARSSRRPLDYVRRRPLIMSAMRRRQSPRSSD